MILPFCIQFLPELVVEIPFMEQSIINNELAELNSIHTEKITPESTTSNFKETNITNLPSATNLFISKKTNLDFPSRQLTWWQIVLLIWLIGFIIEIGRLVLGIRKIHQLSQSSQLFDNNLFFDSSVDILCSAHVETPMTWGFGKAKILLPIVAQTWSKNTLETVLIHELAHIQRKDYWVHILSLVSASFYWFHPFGSGTKRKF